MIAVSLIAVIYGGFVLAAGAKAYEPKLPGSSVRLLPDRRSNPPLWYYLALGDSVPVSNGPLSYPDLILAHYQRKVPGLRLNDIAVSGATTTSMLEGGQYAEAREFLNAHKRHVALITIDIGGNDIVGCVGPTGINAPCAAQARATIKRNLKMMLAGLRASAPGVPVIGMTYYDPFLGYWLAEGALRSLALSTVPSLVTLNRELTSLYGGAKETADVQGIFRSTDFKSIVASPWGAVPIAVKRACSWLDIQCDENAPEGFGDDPNNAGAAAIASVFERTIGPLCVRRGSPARGRC